MNANIETQRNERNFEVIKWVAVVILLVIASVGNYFYYEIEQTLCVFSAAILISIACGIALLTEKGKAIVVFMREARIELRKVIWPTFQETLYTTLIVIAVIAIISLILWTLDIFLVRLISLITNLRL